MTFDYEGTFLNNFPASRRSLIVNQFCYAVRDGAKTLDKLLVAVEHEAERRYAIHHSPEQDDAQLRLLTLFTDDPEEVKSFAAFILWRESLSHAEREQLKSARGDIFKQEYMKKQPPTQKQLKYLEGLGCHVIPANRLEASQLIDKYASGKADAV